MSITRLKQLLTRKVRKGDPKGITIASEELRLMLNEIEAGGTDPQTAINTGNIANNTGAIANIPAIQIETTEIPDGDLLFANSGPITVLANPGRPFAVIGAFLQFTTTNSGGYLGTWTIDIGISGQPPLYTVPSAALESNNFVSGGVTNDVKAFPVGTAIGAFVNTTNNLELTTSADPTGGNSANTFNVHIYYYLI